MQHLLRNFCWLMAFVLLSDSALAKAKKPMTPVPPKPIANYRIATGPETGTYIWLGGDLAKYVAEPAGLNLQVAQSKGSVENIKRLRDEPGTYLALMQSDVLQAYTDMADKGNREATQLVSSLRVVLPLHDTEVHFLVRKDSPLKYIHEIQGKKINIGALGSGDAMTATVLYQALFNTPLLEANANTLNHEEALISMLYDSTLEVAMIVTGQPAPLLVGLEPGVEKNFKLLQLDESHPSTARATKIYPGGVIKASSYPNWLPKDMATFSLKSYLVTREDHQSPASQRFLQQLVESLCVNFKNLQQQGHPKWRQVSLDLPPLNAGWQYYAPTEKVLGQCKARSSASPIRPRPSTCTLSEKALGFCTESDAK